jgi:hypothetical protein
MTTIFLNFNNFMYVNKQVFYVYKNEQNMYWQVGLYTFL